VEQGQLVAVVGLGGYGGLAATQPLVKRNFFLRKIVRFETRYAFQEVWEVWALDLEILVK
jgi:hypothetical protein